MTLRLLLVLGLSILGLTPAGASDSTAPTIEVWKSVTCSCCGAWVKHLEASGPRRTALIAHKSADDPMTPPADALRPPASGIHRLKLVDMALDELETHRPELWV